MEPLIFKIETQADDSGVRQYDKSLGGLDVSSKKASGALKSFSHELLQAKSGADVAAAGAESLSRVLEKSLAGAVVIGGIKIVSDQINKMSEVLRSSGEAASAAITQLERMGEIKGIDDAARATTILNSSIDTIEKSLGAIRDGNWFTKLTGAITGTTEELGKLLASQELYRDKLVALGFAAERYNAETMSGLNDEQKRYEEIQQRLKKRLEDIEKLKDSESRASATRDANALAGIEHYNLTSKLIDEQSKKEEEASKQRQKEVDDRIKKEQELAAVQQKRFNDLYDAEVKAQEATQKRIDANLKAEQDVVDQRKGLVEDVAKAESAPMGGGGGGGGGPRYSGGGGGGAVPGLNTRGVGQRETSAQKGAREANARAEERGRKLETERTQKNVREQLKGKGQPSDLSAVNNEIRRRGEEAAKLQGRNSEGLKDSNDAYESAKNKLQDFDSSLKSSSQATTDYGAGLSQSLSDLDPSFQSAMDSATNLADSIMENSGNMVKDFMNTGSNANDLGEDFSDLGKSASDLSDQMKKSGGGGKGGGGKRPSEDGGGGSLASIEKLLQKNFDELKAYAHAT